MGGWKEIWTLSEGGDMGYEQLGVIELCHGWGRQVNKINHKPLLTSLFVDKMCCILKPNLANAWHCVVWKYFEENVCM